MSNNAGDRNLAEQLQPAVTMLRIIVAALTSGVLAFAGVAALLQLTGSIDGDDQPSYLLSFVAIGIVPVAFVASRIVPSVMVRTARRQIASGSFPSPAQAGPFASLRELGDAGKLYTVYQTKTIVSAAVIEGAAFFSLVAYLVEGNLLALGLGIGLAVAILAEFPSPTRVAVWIDGQLRLMDEEKLLAG